MEYESLDSLGLNWEKFSYEEYFQSELRILKPQMEALGFTSIYFQMGERDSFGPLSRIVYATDMEGNARQFIYG